MPGTALVSGYLERSGHRNPRRQGPRRHREPRWRMGRAAAARDLALTLADVYGARARMTKPGR